MLVLGRHVDEQIVINHDIVITVIEIKGDKVRLGIEAPQLVSIHRREVYDAIIREDRKRALLDAMPTNEDANGIQ